MLKRIRIEWYIITDVCKTILREIRKSKSLKPLKILTSIGEFQIGEDGPIRRGTYYQYLKHVWGVEKKD